MKQEAIRKYFWWDKKLKNYLKNRTKNLETHIGEDL
jgi:hypothetical protein